MQTGDRGPDCLVDTSAAVALVVADHDGHEATFEALGRRRLGLSGHAAFETFSVLTRLPAPLRRTPAATAELLAANFPATRHLSAVAAGELMRRLADEGVAGGAVYDALVAATAAEHELPLATRDRRAVGIYRAFRAEVELLVAA
jgi:predicted nucleic acid-binding protein